MKAKRLLSAFLAVAMMLTTLVALGTVSYAEEVNPKLTIEFVEMTADEVAEVEENLGVSATEGTTAYWLTATLSNYGTLDCTAKATGKGTRKLQMVDMQFTFPGPVANYIDVTSDIADNWYIFDYGVTESALAAVKGDGVEVPGEDCILTVGFAGQNATASYPFAVSEVSDDLIVTQLPILVKSDVTFSLSYSNVKITEFTSKTGVGAEETYSTVIGNLDVTKSFTLGEAAEEGGDDTTVPTVGALTSWGTDGVAIIGRDDVKYDNAYAVTASFENVGTYTKAGVLFIPAAVLDGADLDLNNTAAEDVAATGIGVSDGGTLTVKAAIKGIPREYNGLTMVAKPYIVVGETPYYGAELSEQINFGNTGNK